MPGQGFFKRGLSKLLGATDKAAPTPRGPDAPQPQPQQAAPQQAAPLGPTPTPINPQAGQLQRAMSMADTDEAISELGAQGVMGAQEGANVVGRTKRRNINLDFYENDQTKRTLELFNRKADGYKDNPARKVQSHEETIAKSTGSGDAEAAEVALNRVLNGKLSDKFSPEDLVSIFDMANTQAEELQGFASELKARRVGGEEIPTEELVQFKLLSTRLNALLEVASVRSGEAGRMLNAMQAISKLTNKQYLKEMQDIVGNSGGRETVAQNIDAVVEAKGLGGISGASNLTTGKKLWNTILQWRYNMMLSSVRTHAANLAGSASTGTYEMMLVNPARVLINNAEFGTRAVINATFKSVDAGTRVPQIERIQLSEMVSLPYAAIKNIRAGLSSAKRVYTGEELGKGKLYNELGIRTMGAGKDSFLPSKFQGVTRLLEAEDTFFKSMYGNAQIEVLAKRQALKEGGTAKQINERTKYLMNHPPEDILDAAGDFAKKLTFTSDPSIYGSIFKGINEAVGKLQDSVGLAKILIPFRNTPINITGYVIENTPLRGLVAPRKLLADLKGEDTRADAVSRLAISTGLMYYAESLWEEGTITGAAPKNYGELRVRQAAGWEPNSISIGGKMHTLNRLDPAGLILGVYATYFDAQAMMTEGDRATAAAAAVVAVATLITDRSMLASIGDLERVFQASEGSVGRHAGKLGARMATGFIMPALVRDVREMSDDRARAIDVPSDLGGAVVAAFTKTVYNAVPGLSDQLPPAVTAFGDDRINTSAWYYRGTLPIKTTTLKQDPTVAALLAMDIPLGKPDSVVKLAGDEVRNAIPIDLLAIDGGAGWVYRAYQQSIGKARHKAVTEFVSTADFQAAVDGDMLSPDGLYAEQLQNKISRATRLAKSAFIRDVLTSDSIQPRVAGENIGKRIDFTHKYSTEQYLAFAQLVSDEGMTEDISKQAIEAGYKPKFKPANAGLPKQLKLKKSTELPRF